MISIPAQPGQLGQIYGFGIKDGRGYGPYGAGYYDNNLPLGPQGQKLSKEYDFTGQPLAWTMPSKILPGFVWQDKLQKSSKPKSKGSKMEAFLTYNSPEVGYDELLGCVTREAEKVINQAKVLGQTGDQVGYSELLGYNELLGTIGYSELLGAGLDFISPIFQTAGQLVQTGVNIAQQEKEKKKSAADDQAALQAAMAADKIAAMALAAVEATKALIPGSIDTQKRELEAKARVQQVAADAALAAQDRAGVRLSEKTMSTRIDAAARALMEATSKLSSDPSVYNQALVKAWSTIVNKAQHGQIVQVAQTQSSTAIMPTKTENWFVKPVLGPVPGWGVTVGGVGLATALGFAIKALVK